MLGLSEHQIRGFVSDDLVSPTTGKRGEFLFSFQDLVVLRTAKELIDADIPTRRVKSALERLREQLPGGRPLTGVQIFADGREVAVRQGDEIWNPESGQTLFNFEVSDLAELAAPFARETARAARDRAAELEAEDWYELGCELEMTSIDDARDAYERTLELDPEHPDAHLNLGRLLHEKGDPASAERHYRAALQTRPGDVTARFNLGVALQDLGRRRQAVETYRRVLDSEPGHADAHYNLSVLYEDLGQKALALRHLATYRRRVQES